MVRLGDSRDGFIRGFLIAKTTRLTTSNGIPSPLDSWATCLNRFIEYYRRNFANNPDQSTHDLGNRSADRLSKGIRYRLLLWCRFAGTHKIMPALVLTIKKWYLKFYRLNITYLIYSRAKIYVISLYNFNEWYKQLIYLIYITLKMYLSKKIK